MARTWGQIRLELNKALPGNDIELLTGWIQSAYQFILDKRDWGGLRRRTVLQVPAAYGTEPANGTSLTCQVTQGSNIVSANTGTVFVSDYAGWLGFFDAGRETYALNFVSSTQMTLDRNYAGPSNAAATFLLAQTIFPLPPDCKYVEQVENPYLSVPMDKKSRSELEDIQAQGVSCGAPYYWAPDDDSIEDTPPVLHTVRIWPTSRWSVGLPMTFQKAAIAFDGTNTASSPLPWVSDDAIIFLAKSFALAHGKDYPGADRAKADAGPFLANMDRAETTREGPARLQMASRFTRHRTKRWGGSSGHSLL